MADNGITPALTGLNFRRITGSACRYFPQSFQANFGLMGMEDFFPGGKTAGA
jgi:hypothetical protein